MGGEWPLVGREGKLREFAGQLIHEHRSLVLAGPAGVGKTRLASELLERCERAGFATVRLTGTNASASIPFGALAPVLPALDRSDVGRVDDKADFLRRSAAKLLENAAPRRLAVMVDDAHLLDGASATLIHQLAARQRVGVIATVRSGEPAPDPVVALWKDDLAERREVAGLSAPAIGELVSTVLSGPIDSGAATQLVERSQGNVLFLRELVVGAVDSGALRAKDGIWRLAGGLAPSDRLSEIIGIRLAGLSDGEMAVLELVALGEPLRLEELRALGDPVVAEGLERIGLLATRQEQRRLIISFGHPLYGDVVRQRMPALRRRVLARSLAEVAEPVASAAEDLLRIGAWRLDGGGGTSAQMLAAASAARWRYDFRLAAQLVAAAGAGFEAELLSAQLAQLEGRGEEAEAQYARLADVARGDDQIGSLALSRIDNIAFYLGRPDTGARIAEEAAAVLAEPAWRDQIQARHSALVFAIEGPRAGASVASPILVRADGQALVWAAQVAAFTLGRLGEIEAALDATERGHHAHLQLDQPTDWYPWTHLFFRSQVHAWNGDLDSARRLAEEQYHLSLVDHSPEQQAWFAWQRASTVAEDGEVASAVHYGREAIAIFSDLGRPQFMAFSLTYLATALALSGEASEASEALAALDRLGVSDYFMGVDPMLARAWTVVAQGDLPSARGLFRRAASFGSEIGDLVGRASALHALARIGAAKEVEEPLSEVAVQASSHLIKARAAHTSALARDDLEALGDVTGVFKNMGAHLLAAESAADAVRMWRKRGDSRRATAAERDARVYAEACPDAITPALTEAKGRVVLTTAERDAALLAGAGRSNKEIAQELCLSVRTVEGRLQRAYTRLGVSSRLELVEVLHDAAGES